MEKITRNAVRCFLFSNNRIVVIKYKEGLKKGYYDIPGGKIEEGESLEEAGKREFKEETGMFVDNFIYKGKICIEYPDRKYILNVIIAKTYSGEPEDFSENTSKWINVEKFQNLSNRLACTTVLSSKHIDDLLNDDIKFNMNILVNDNEKILNVEYTII